MSAVAPTCVEANAWTTAAVVWGDDAPGNLVEHGVTARLVHADGHVVTIGGWPGVANVGPLGLANHPPATDQGVR